MVTFDLDGEAPWLWTFRHQRPDSIAELEQRRFDWRRGVDRILALLIEHRIRATFYVPGFIVEKHPELVREIAVQGHCLGLHGWLHEPPSDLSRAQLAETIERSLNAFEAAGVGQPNGFRSPAWDMPLWAIDVLLEHGIHHDSSLMGDDVPYRIGELIELPVDWHTDDVPFLRIAPTAKDRGSSSSAPGLVSPRDLLGAWIDELHAARAFGTLVNFTMHPWVSARPGPANVLVRNLLHQITQLPDVWIATADEVARWYSTSASSEA